MSNLFDLTGVTGSGIPDGDHVATIASAEVKSTKAGTGEYINVKWELEDKSSFFAIYNIKNPNQQAVNIALAELKRMIAAAGSPLTAVSSAEQLLGLRCVLTLKNETGDYGDQVRIKKYKPAPAANPFG